MSHQIDLAIALADAADETAMFELPEVGPFVPTYDAADIDTGDEDDAPRPASVVAGRYKQRYAERAATRVGLKKADRRKLASGCGDWLHRKLADLTLDDDLKLVVPAFEAILDANGVAHAHWNRTTPGWQGRLRMTGRLALQRKVAEAEQLVLADGSVLVPPMAWVERTIR